MKWLKRALVGIFRHEIEEAARDFALGAVGKALEDVSAKVNNGHLRDGFAHAAGVTLGARTKATKIAEMIRKMEESEARNGG